MIVSIQLICIAISLVTAATLTIGAYRDAAWLRIGGGVIRNLMFAFVLFTFLLTILVALVRPY